MALTTPGEMHIEGVNTIIDPDTGAGIYYHHLIKINIEKVWSKYLDNYSGLLTQGIPFVIMLNVNF